MARRLKLREEPPPRPVAEVLASIRKKSENVRAAATALNECIRDFETYLKKLPGHLEASAYGEHPDQASMPELSVAVKLIFHRNDKDEWCLEVGTYADGYNDEPDNPVKLRPLVDAPLKMKLAALKIFPDLLAAMEKSQDQIAKQIQEGTAAYLTFRAELDAATKGVK